MASSYSKDEAALTLNDLRDYDYLLTSKDPKALAPTFELLQAFETFDRVHIKSFLPQICTKTYIYLMRNTAKRSSTTA
uniref:Uncharacterized protein n=1 Tax=Globisporangium ultimum (strain ATCC 200006 / CBS 805.95 / DAOM BR144) TaxID=431595 RepID=K3X0B2_GLOUD